MPHSKEIIRLAPPERPRRRPAGAYLALFGLCLAPIYVAADGHLTRPDKQPRPTATLVETLNHALLAPAQAHALPPALARIDPPATITAPNRQSPLPGLTPMAQKPLFLGPAGDRERAVNCLALAAWFEAGNDIESERSVIQVVLNRVAHPSFPKSVCGVVFQGSERSTGCQFTFTCDGSMLRRYPSRAALARARALALLALQGDAFPAVMQATHYHADYVVPWWSSQLVFSGKVGRHIFYSWPGKRGILPGRPRSVGEADFARSIADAAARRSGSAGPAAQSAAQDIVPTAHLAAAKPALAVQAAPGLAAKPQGSIFMTIDGAQPSGRWAVTALGRCAGKAACRVLGYQTPDQAARNSSIGAGERAKPLFLFVRDAASGIELALWDCDRVTRPAPSQCLPAPGRELARMLRDSQS